MLLGRGGPLLHLRSHGKIGDCEQSMSSCNLPLNMNNDQYVEPNPTSPSLC